MKKKRALIVVQHSSVGDAHGFRKGTDGCEWQSGMNLFQKSIADVG